MQDFINPVVDGVSNVQLVVHRINDVDNVVSTADDQDLRTMLGEDSLSRYQRELDLQVVVGAHATE